MKIAILGYGKMGKEIEKISLERGHEIVLIIDEKSEREISKKVDVAINFCTPQTAYKNIRLALSNNIPVVSGTTGWLANYPKIEELSRIKQTGFLYSSNFSLGVNLFFELNKNLSKIMNNHLDYRLSINEVHHVEKKDKPSGTAIKLAEDIIKNSKFTSWSNSNKNDSIFIKSLRKNAVPGKHTVKYSSSIDEIKISHKANNRKGFAIGAVIAAEWIIGKTGVYEMSDVIKNIKFK